MTQIIAGAAVVLAIYFFLGNLVPEAVAVAWWTGFWETLGLLLLLACVLIIAIIIACSGSKRPQRSDDDDDNQATSHITVNGDVHINIIADSRTGRRLANHYLGNGRTLNGRSRILEHDGDD